MQDHTIRTRCIVYGKDIEERYATPIARRVIKSYNGSFNLHVQSVEPPLPENQPDDAADGSS